MIEFKVGQRIIGPWFSGVVEHFEDYHGSPHQVFEQPTTHTDWRVGIRLETVESGRPFQVGQVLYYFHHQFSDFKLSSVQDAV